jgi:hypothetical protein
VPGIASVLRSPVADALVQMVRAGAGLEEFRYEGAQELVQYAIRRGLIGASEGEDLLAVVKPSGAHRSRSAAAAKPRPKAPEQPASKPHPQGTAVRRGFGRPVKKATKRAKRR